MADLVTYSQVQKFAYPSGQNEKAIHHPSVINLWDNNHVICFVLMRNDVNIRGTKVQQLSLKLYPMENCLNLKKHFKHKWNHSFILSSSCRNRDVLTLWSYSFLHTQRLFLKALSVCGYHTAGAKLINLHRICTVVLYFQVI